MHRVKARALLPLFGLAALAPQAGAALHTFGRRLAVGPGDVLVLTDPDRDRVAVFDVAGDAPRKLAEFGTRGERPGRLRAPHGAAIDTRGSLVVVDSFNHRLQSYDLKPLLDGRGPRLVRSWGAYGHGARQLDTPVSGIAVLPGEDGRDLLFVADTRNHRIVSFDRSGRSAGPVMGGRGAGGGQLDWPSGLAVDAARSVLYVAEQGNRRVSAFDARSGSFLFAFGGQGAEAGGLQVPVDVAVDAAGDVWVVDQAARRVVRFAPVPGPGGVPRGVRPVASWGRVGAGPGAWEYPQAIAVDARRRVYVADRLDGRCQFFSSEGAFLGAFGSDVGAGGPEGYGPAPGGPPEGPMDVCSNGGSYGLRARAQPEPAPLNEYFSLDVQVREGCRGSTPAAGVGLAVDAWMPEHAHGMTTLVHVVPQPAVGRFLASGLLLHMPGRWELYLDVVRDGVLERAQLELLLQ
jgi:DNA-binding beta-propeller fold protein YncE